MLVKLRLVWHIHNSWSAQLSLAILHGFQAGQCDKCRAYQCKDIVLWWCNVMKCWVFTDKSYAMQCVGSAFCGVVVVDMASLWSLLYGRCILLHRTGHADCTLWCRLCVYIRSIWSFPGIPAAVDWKHDSSALHHRHCRIDFCQLRDWTSVSNLWTAWFCSAPSGSRLHQYVFIT